MKKKTIIFSVNRRKKSEQPWKERISQKPWTQPATKQTSEALYNLIYNYI